MAGYRLSPQEQAIYESLQTPLAVYQLVAGKILTVALSDGFCDLLGTESREHAYAAMNQDTFTFVHPDDIKRVRNAVALFMKDGGTFETIYRLKDQYGYRIIHAMGKHVYTKTGARLAQVWYMDEGAYIEKGNGTALSQSLSNALHEESILKASFYDALTGLPNLSHFFDLTELKKDDLSKSGESTALLYIDLNGMKYYNHKYGFAEGDKLLMSFSRLLSSAFGAENCGHVSADRFTVFTKEAGLELALDHLFDEAARLNDGRSLPVRIGIYPSRIEEVAVSFAYDRAKIACEEMRRTDISCYNYYNEELRDHVKMSHYIQSNLDRAIAEKWIQPYYQPILRAVNEKVCDVEALARWIDPKEGYLQPVKFIPFLEEAGLIYKLDLYILEQVLQKIQQYKASGLTIVPHSINLSRSDFDACDIVEEIRRRVDEAGVERSKITIEITESVIGSDFPFMKQQVERFRQLGFPVWMDDFGTGYSSLDVLQSIKFDLVKFDMGFMRKLDDGDNGKIILTELMKMVTCLGVDTICEGVETKEQVQFLQEIGCSKLQGYFYSKPVPIEEIRAQLRSSHPLRAENPAESQYYETIGRVNLFDLTMLANTDDNIFHNTFSSVPMGIVELNGDKARFVRINQSWKTFVQRFFHYDIAAEGRNFATSSGPFLFNIAKSCSEQSIRSLVEKKLPDGSVIHSFSRRIGVNPVNGNTAVAIAVLSVTESDSSTTYVDIARALAADYYNIYVVDLNTDQFIEYNSPVGGQEIAVERHGDNFFEPSNHQGHHIYEEDLESFYASFSKEKIIRALDEQGVFNLTYRLIDAGVPEYMNMKIIRMQPGGSKIIIGISNVDAQMKQKAHLEEVLRGHDTLVRVMALSDGYLSLFTVDPVSDRYIEYGSTDAYDSLGLAKEGEDFFRQSVVNAERCFHPEDFEIFKKIFTKENVMKEIRKNGSFSTHYRLMLNGEMKHVVLKIAPFKERESEKLVVGLREWQERR